MARTLVHSYTPSYEALFANYQGEEIVVLSSTDQTDHEACSENCENDDPINRPNKIPKLSICCAERPPLETDPKFRYYEYREWMVQIEQVALLIKPHHKVINDNILHAKILHRECHRLHKLFSEKVAATFEQRPALNDAWRLLTALKQDPTGILSCVSDYVHLISIISDVLELDVTDADTTEAYHLYDEFEKKRHEHDVIYDLKLKAHDALFIQALSIRNMALAQVFKLDKKCNPFLNYDCLVRILLFL